MRKLTAFLREDWPRLVVELLVLVVGITLSFVINEWREGLNHRAAERRTLEGVRDNLRADTAALGAHMRRLQTMLHAYDRLLAPEGPATLPPDSVDVYMDLAISYVGFKPSDQAYEEMRQTGGSAYVRNKALLNALISLYNREVFRAGEWDAIDRNFILERMIPYVDDHAPYVPTGTTGEGVVTGMLPVYRALAGENRFRNLLRTNRLFKEAHHTVYGITRARIDSVLVMVDRELARR